MGDRYIIDVVCPKCKNTDKDVYYAPTCGFTHHKCSICKFENDLAIHTGITYEDCSNKEEITELVRDLNRKFEK